MLYYNSEAINVIGTSYEIQYYKMAKVYSNNNIIKPGEIFHWIDRLLFYNDAVLL